MGFDRATDTSPCQQRFHLLKKGGGQVDAASEQVTESAEDVGRRRGKRLLCSICGFPITTAGARMQVNGSHVHTFANPHGYVYRIGCFLTAPGCLSDHRESEDFTWFAGYSWSIEACGRCYTHMGWRFRSPGSSFHGLVLERLVEEEGDGDRDRGN